MSETQWWIDNPDFCFVENLLETLAELDIYWHHTYPDDDEKDDLMYDLKYDLWEKYHKPYIENKKLNPLKYISSLRRKCELFMVRCRDYWSQ